MLASQALEGNLGVSCLRRQFGGNGKIFVHRARATAAFRSSACLPQKNGPGQPYRGDEAAACEDDQSGGAMSRRLSEMTEETIEHGGRSAQKAVDEAGFSDELKRRLEAKIADGNFRSEHPAAFASLDMPVSVPSMLKGRSHAHHRIVQCWTRYP